MVKGATNLLKKYVVENLIMEYSPGELHENFDLQPTRECSSTHEWVDTDPYVYRPSWETKANVYARRVYLCPGVEYEA